MPDFLYPICKFLALANGIIREEKTNNATMFKASLTKGREIPINDLNELLYSKSFDFDPKPNTLDEINSAKNYTELTNPFILYKYNKEIEFLLFFSNCPTRNDLINALIFDDYSQRLANKPFDFRLKWFYEKDLKGFLKSLYAFPTDALNVSGYRANSRCTDHRFRIRYDWAQIPNEESLNNFTTNEENWLAFDAFQLCQFDEWAENARPNSINEYIVFLLKKNYARYFTHYVNKPEWLRYPSDYMTQHPTLHKDMLITYEPFLKRYGHLFAKYNETYLNKKAKSYRAFLMATKHKQIFMKILSIPTNIMRIL
ncbi:hypothetical protein [Pseudomonas syringae]|uniref:hypothetical protein n=1 Tax=Pseudomonas syringae TaxID=317 RepID=UPI000D9386F8|nr:hypothetical protein [Pseudomonas syringae]PYD33613.1 hypothetical protein DND67_11075 [Pseudomonas syringae pv. pisi]